MLILMGLYVGGGLLLTGLSLPLILRKIKPNSFYGFRVKETLADSRVWYAVNAYAGWRLLFTGVATILAALGFSFIPGISLDVYAWCCLGVFALVFGVGIIQNFLYLRGYTKRL